MCFDLGIGEALAIGGALAGAGTSAAQAVSRNRAIERSAASQYQATTIENNQLAAQANQTKLQRSQEAQRLRALAIVQASGRGVSTDSGSVKLWQQQALLDEARNRTTIDTNLQYQTDRNTSAYNANAASLKSQSRDPFLDTFLGGLQGLSTGLSIASGVEKITAPGPLTNVTGPDSGIMYPEDIGPVTPPGWSP